MTAASGDLAAAGRNVGESGGSGLFGRAGVFRWFFFGLLCAIVAADGDLLAAYLDLDPAIVDVPIAYWAFGRVHKFSFPFLSLGFAAPFAARRGCFRRKDRSKAGEVRLPDSCSFR